jgi:hypothetical protein
MSEIDPELDATWRAVSREQPPAALDDAIRAAARQEVGAKPGGFAAATRWWPLAAAATVAAIAVGIVQMTPPEQVTPGTNTAANNAATDAAQRNVKPDSDTSNANQGEREVPGPAAPPEAPRDASKPTAKEQRRGAGDESDRGVPAPTRSDRFAAPPRGETRDRAAAPEALHGANKSTAEERRLGAGREDDRGELVRQRSENFAAAPGGQFQQKKSVDSPQQAPPQRVEEASERDQVLKRKAEFAAASSAARPNAAVPNPPPSPVARNELQPFPATPAPAESQVSNAPPPMASTERTAAPASVSPPAPAVAARKLAAQSSATGALADNNAGSSAGKIASNAELAPGQDAAALEKRAAGMPEKVTAERRKDTAPLAPDAWIRRIRRLIAEGKNDEAGKELVAFRREYKERAETLLPADLRAFRP